MENRCFVSLAKETCRIFMFQLQFGNLLVGQSWCVSSSVCLAARQQPNSVLHCYIASLLANGMAIILLLNSYFNNFVPEFDICTFEWIEFLLQTKLLSGTKRWRFVLKCALFSVQFWCTNRADCTVYCTAQQTHNIYIQSKHCYMFRHSCITLSSLSAWFCSRVSKIIVQTNLVILTAYKITWPFILIKNLKSHISVSRNKTKWATYYYLK
jgi:hypothetical protein